MNYSKEIKKLQARVEELEKKSGGVKKPQHKKITLDKFWEDDAERAIYCKTEEQAAKLCNAFDKIGKTWADGFSYAEKIGQWEDCFYWNDGKRSGCSYGEEEVYNFEDVIFPDEPEPRWSFTEDEKTILRNVEEGYKWLVRDADKTLWLYSVYKPEKKEGNWESRYSWNFPFDSIFQCIKWSDDEPCEFRKFL